MLHAVTARCPASVMVLGEHAVVYGGEAICAALNRTLSVTCTPLPSGRVILSGAGRFWEGNMTRLPDEPCWRFVRACLEEVMELMPPHGIRLDIDSDIPDNQGLGSSAAVTAATLGALLPQADLRMVFTLARRAIRRVQGRGSGADAAAAVYGGVIAYRAWPCRITPLPVPGLELRAIYCGYKVPTSEVLSRLRQSYRLRPAVIGSLLRRIAETATVGISAWQRGDFDAVGACMCAHQECMRELKLSDGTLEGIIAAASAYPAKISGSGLGDCVIALTPAEKLTGADYRGPGTWLDVSWSRGGLVRTCGTVAASCL